MKPFRGSMSQTIVMVLLFIILLSSAGSLTFQLSSTGYSSGFEGPKARFVGVKSNGKTYTSFEPSGASMASFDTGLRFDIDGADTGKPNIIGEMTAVFVPEQSTFEASWLLSHTPQDIASQWTQSLSYIKNPQQTYAWNISGKTYKMEQWLMKWYVTFSVEWDGTEGGKAFSPGWVDRNYYSNTEAWIEFDISPTWYIQGGGTAYFAIAQLRTADVNKAGKMSNGEWLTPETMESVSPESASSILFLSYGLWGAEGYHEIPANAYQGKELNPALFRDKVYAHIDFNNFGATTWNELPATVKTKGDVATFSFDVVVFVIGEWQVKDIQKPPDLYGRDIKANLPPSLIDYLNDPKVQALIMLAVTAGIILLLLMFAPWVLIAIFSMFGGRRRR